MGDTLHHRVWCQKREVTRTREYIHTHACSRVEQRAESNLQAADKHVACVSHVTGQSVTSQVQSIRRKSHADFGNFLVSGVIFWFCWSHVIKK